MRVNGNASNPEGHVRTPAELINLYWEEVWNKGNTELIRELCADPIVRHDPGSVTLLSLDEQVNRVTQHVARGLPHFEHRVLIANDEYVTSVWNMTSSSDEALVMCGIETFRAENGRFTDCWNSPSAMGRWGEIGDEFAIDDVPPALIDDWRKIDSLWLQRIFKAAGVDVPRIDMVQKVEPIANGCASTTVRFHFVYNVDASGFPETLVGKFPSSDPVMRKSRQTTSAYAREVEAYRFLGESPPFRIPQAYFAEFGDDGGFNLVLEDIGGEARPGNQLAGCSIREAEAVAKELAALHCAYWNRADVQQLPWLNDFSNLDAMLAEGFDLGVARLSETIVSALPDNSAEIFSLVRDRIPRLLGAASFAGRTLIHGDPRVDNVIFEGPFEAPRACLVDLQFMGFGDPMFDLANFLGGSLAPPDRRDCERMLVERHVATLREVDPDYTKDEAWEHYRAFTVATLVITVGAAGLVDRSEHNDKLLTALVTRNIAAILDLDGIAAAASPALME